MKHLEHLINDLAPEEEAYDEPAYVQVLEHESGRFTSTVSMKLDKLQKLPHATHQSCEHPEAVAGQSNAIHNLLSNLNEGQSLHFRYEWRRELMQKSRFEWTIALNAGGVSREESALQLSNLNRSFRCTFASPSCGLVFNPVPTTVGEGIKSDWPYQYSIRPRGIQVDGTRRGNLGFRREILTAPPVVLSAPVVKGNPDFDSIIYSAEAAGCGVSVTAHVKPVVLSEVSISALQESHDLVNDLFGHVRYKDISTSIIQDEEFLTVTRRKLDRWLNTPSGYCVQCTVNSERPLPTSLLHKIGRDIFGCMEIDERSADTVSSSDSNSIELDLSDCVHPLDPGINMVPSTSSLEDVGIPRAFPSTSNAFSNEGLLLGKSGVDGPTQDVRISDTDRARHCYILGATGTGKSTLLSNMVLQDIYQGKGVCLIDPHGDLYDQLLGLIPESRADDVVLVDVTDREYSVGINFLECGGKDKDLQMNFITNEMMSIFGRLYDLDHTGGPIFETYMRNAMLCVMDSDYGPATMLDIVRFFEDKDFRDKAKQRCRNKLASSFWNRQADRVTGEAALHNVAPYITSKLNRFVHNALLRPIIGQPKSTIDFRVMMDEQRIVLVNLAKGVLGELDTRLLGMLIVGKIFNAALSRVNTAQSNRVPFHLYADEFQNIATPTTISLLSEARKFGLSFVMANQHLAQLSAGKEKVDEAILANVSNMLSFRLGPTDAEILEAYTRPILDEQDLQQLPDRHVACRMLNNNRPINPFVFNAQPPPQPTIKPKRQAEVRVEMKRNSRDRYTRNRAQVEVEIANKWNNHEAEE